MLKFLNSWRMGIFRVACAVAEGVGIGLTARQPVMPVVDFCLIFTAMRLRLEALLP